jgi:hypothetical protein
VFQGGVRREGRVGGVGDGMGGYSAPRGDFDVDHDDLAELRVKDVDFTACYDPLFFSQSYFRLSFMPFSKSDFGFYPTHCPSISLAIDFSVSRIIDFF